MTTHWTCQECGGYANDDGGYLVCINCGFLARQGWLPGAVDITSLSTQVAHLRTVALKMLRELPKDAA